MRHAMTAERIEYDDLDAAAQAKIAQAVKNFLRDGGYENLLHVMLEFEMQPQELWSMIMRESGLPDCTMPLTIQIGFNH